MANGISQFAQEGKTGEIYNEAFAASMQNPQSAESSGHTYVLWCIEDTIENTDLDFPAMYADYLKRVIERLDSYKEYVECVNDHTGKDAPRMEESAYIALALPYRSQLKAIQERSDEEEEQEADGE
jgi:hypothetical protein